MAILGLISVVLLVLLVVNSFFGILLKLDQKYNKASVYKKPATKYRLSEKAEDLITVDYQEVVFNYLKQKEKATLREIMTGCSLVNQMIVELINLGIIVEVVKNEDVKVSYVKGIIFPILITLVFISANYFLLIKLNIRYVGVIIYVALMLHVIITYSFKYFKNNYKIENKVKISIGFAVIFVLAFYFVFGGRTYLHAEQYSNLITLTEEEFSSDVNTVDVDSLPIVDKQYGQKLGSLKLGEYPGIGSEFEAGDYSDIIYQGEQYLVAPLEYTDIFKWLNNNKVGTPGYILINKVTAETTLVNLREDTNKGLIYTPSAYFNQDLTRHAYYNGMSKYNLEATYFEINDEGVPFYIMQYSLPTIFINGGRDIAKIAVVNALDGKVNVYDPEEVPAFIESVYPSDLLLTQLNYWGTLQDGWINSFIGQKGVLQPSNGKRTIMNDGELFYFTGLTSAGSDESTVGFVYMSTRTKETKLFKFPGATESAATNKTLTLLPQNNISTSFPIPINVNNTPTYFIAIKGEDGRILRHIFMDVQELEVYGIADTKNKAYSNYLLSLSDNTEVEIETVIGDITSISSYVSEGNTIYWVELDNDQLYLINVSNFDIDEMMHFISKEVGDEISFEVKDHTVIEIVLP